MEGQKDGHGSLTLKDGTFIQGDFQKGEITGIGMKVWPGGKQTYKGNFHKGHMDGHGEMQYADGSTVRCGTPPFICKTFNFIQWFCSKLLRYNFPNVSLLLD